MLSRVALSVGLVACVLLAVTYAKPAANDPCPEFNGDCQKCSEKAREWGCGYCYDSETCERGRVSGPDLGDCEKWTKWQCAESLPEEAREELLTSRPPKEPRPDANKKRNKKPTAPNPDGAPPPALPPTRKDQKVEL